MKWAACKVYQSVNRIHIPCTNQMHVDFSVPFSLCFRWMSVKIAFLLLYSFYCNTVEPTNQSVFLHALKMPMTSIDRAVSSCSAIWFVHQSVRNVSHQLFKINKLHLYAIFFLPFRRSFSKTGLFEFFRLASKKKPKISICLYCNSKYHYGISHMCKDTKNYVTPMCDTFAIAVKRNEKTIMTFQMWRATTARWFLVKLI